MADPPPGATNPTAPLSSGEPAPAWPPPGVPGVVVAPPGVVAPPRRRRTGWRTAGLALAILFIAACAVTILAIVGVSIGLEGLIVGSAAAVLPVPILVSCFLWLDRYEPEPVRALILVFGWGAFAATLASLWANQFGADLFERWGLPDWAVAVLVAPVVEETAKALGPLLVLVFFRREFSGLTDGIVYCGLSAIGFAMVENILYLGGLGYAAGAEKYGPATGAMALIAMFIGRIMLTGFAHPLFTAMTGIGLGLSARAADTRVRIFAPIAGWLVAMMLHGSWNLMATFMQQGSQLMVALYGYFAVMMPVFLGMVGFAIWLRAWEGRLTERILPHYVAAGWLAPPEVAALGTLGRRHAARAWARRVAGEGGRRAMRDFQFAATRLALLRDGMQRGLDRKPRDAQRSAAEERSLLELMSARRQVFAGRDPLAPPAFWDGSRYLVTFPDGVRRTIDAPTEPVVPIPVLAPAPPPAYQPGYPPPAPPGYPAPGYPRPVYAPPGYPQASAPPGYPTPGYAPQASAPPADPAGPATEHRRSPWAG